MGISASVKKLLNDFGLSQPSLRDATKPYPASQLKLGDTLDALSAMDSTSVTYDFAVHGGSIGAKTMTLAFPKGSIITRVWTDELTALTSGGAATIALKVGAQDLRAAAAYAVYAGVVEHVASLPVKLTASGKLDVTIAGAALTAGKVKIYVEWLKA